MKNYAEGKPKTRRKIERHWLNFHKIWQSFERVAEECLAFSSSNVVCIEWPTICAYWGLPMVQNFLQRHGFVQHHIHGCAYGLVGQTTHMGKPILKPWTIATTCDTDVRYLSKRCPGGPAHRNHAACEGKETKLTEEYTWPLVNAVPVSYTHLTLPTICSV